jgi:hypothetical protein
LVNQLANSRVSIRLLIRYFTMTYGVVSLGGTHRAAMPWATNW